MDSKYSKSSEVSSGAVESTTNNITSDEQAFRLLLQITMGLTFDEPNEHTVVHTLKRVLLDQAKLEMKKSLFGSGLKLNSRRSSRRGSFRGRRGSMSYTESVSVTESVFESDTTLDPSSIAMSEDETSEARQSTSEVDELGQRTSKDELQAAILQSFAPTESKNDKKKQAQAQSSRTRGSRNKKKYFTLKARRKSATLDFSESEEDKKSSEEHAESSGSGKSRRGRSGSRIGSIRLSGNYPFGSGNISRTASPVLNRKKSNSVFGYASDSSQEDPAKKAIEEKMARVELANSLMRELDEEQLTKLILILALVNPKNDGAEHYAIHTTGEQVKSHRVVRVGSCSLFNDPATDGKMTTHSVLFCTDPMLKPISDVIKKEFLAITLENLTTWVNLVSSITPATSLNEKKMEYLCVNLPRMQALMKKSASVTPLELLDPTIIPSYRKLFDYKFTNDRFRNLPHLKKGKIGQAVLLESCSTKKLLQTINTVTEDWKNLPSVISDLARGKKVKFLALKTNKCKEEVMNQLDLKSANRFVDSTVQHLLTENVFSPQQLNLSNWAISEDKLIRILKKNGMLISHLDLSYCEKITEKTLKAISEHCKHLQALVLTGTNINTIPAEFTNLISLDLSECSQLSEDVIKKIGSNCPQLQVLKLNGTSLNKINLGRLNLTTIEANNCPQLRNIYTKIHNLKKKMGTLKTPRKSKSGSRLSPRAMATTRRLAYITASNNPKLKRLLIKDDSAPIGISANNNPCLEGVLVTNGEKIRQLHFDNSANITEFKVSPDSLKELSLNACHDIAHELSEVINLFLLDLVIGSKFDVTPPIVAGNAMTILLRTKKDFINWAKQASSTPYFDKWIPYEKAIGEEPGAMRGDAVFVKIKIPRVNASYCSLASADLFQADLSNALLHQTDFSHASLFETILKGARFFQKIPFNDHDDGYLTAVAHSHDGNLIATADGKNKVIVRSDSEILFTFDHSQSVNSLAFSPDGKHLVTGGSCFDRDLQSHKKHYDDRVHPKKTLDNILHSAKKGLSFPHPDMNAHFINVWSLDTQPTIIETQDSEQLLPALLHSYYTHQKEVDQVAFSPCGSLIASCDENSLRVRNWQTGNPKMECKPEDDEPVFSFAYHPSENIIVIGGNQHIFVWNTITGNMIQRFHAHDTQISSLKFSDDGSMLVSCSYDKTVKVWTYPDWKLKNNKPFRGHRNDVSCAVILPNNQFVASADDVGRNDAKLLIWDINTREVILECVHPDSIRAISVKPTKEQHDKGWEVLTACTDGLVRRWLVTGEIIRGPDTKIVASKELTFKGCEVDDARLSSKKDVALVAAFGAIGIPTVAFNAKQDESKVAERVQFSVFEQIVGKPVVFSTGDNSAQVGTGVAVFNKTTK